MFLQCPLLELVARSDCPSNVLGVSEEFTKHCNALPCAPFLLSGLLCWKLAAMIGTPSKGMEWVRPGGGPWLSTLETLEASVQQLKGKW